VSPALAGANINLDGVPGAAAGVGGADAVNPQSLDAQFSEDIGLITPASLHLTNVTTGEDVPASYIAVAYDPATFVAHFTFPGYENGELPDGNYQGTVVADQTADVFGNNLAADAPFDFFFVAGDANHDRTIDLTDFTVLAANFNGSDKHFSEGDYNYDAFVDLTDFTILASKFNQPLDPPAAAAAAAVTTAGAATASAPVAQTQNAPVSSFSSNRIVDDVLLTMTRLLIA
jgi:hypothetical protein